MDSLSSTFLPRFSQPKPSSVPLHTTPPSTITANYPFTTFDEHIKKLISNTEKIKPKIKQPLQEKISLNKRKKHSLLSTIFKSIDDFICDTLDLPLRPSIDPKHVLSGNFSPVAELPPTACDVVEGSLPISLNGVYLRNGPNPQFVPPRGPYHLFDGDGMLHMIKISSGKATFCSRYVKTYKYTVESYMGYPIFPSLFSSINGVMASMARVVMSAARVIAGEFNPAANGIGTVNISVAHIGGKLYALGESDLPYEIKVTTDGDVITLRRHDFQCVAAERFLTMTAHPKIDRETGEAFAFRYDVVPPRLSFFRIDSDGRKQPDVPIFAVKSTAVIHDFAVTENFAIFNDLQIVISPFEILKGRTPAKVDRIKIPRLGIIRKYAENESEMWWIDAPGLNVAHAVNAWEEDGGDTVVMVATNLSTVEMALERLDLAQSRLEVIRVRVKEKKVERRPLSDKVLEMPVINPAYVGKKNRYVYCPVVATPMMIVGVVKVDLWLSSDNCHDCVVGTRMYEPGCTGNEPFFVAKEPNNSSSDEDDGFLVTYVHDERSQESKFLVMDAKSPILEIVAVVKLPGRVPTGFHGLFVTESCLSKLGSISRPVDD